MQRMVSLVKMMSTVKEKISSGNLNTMTSFFSAYQNPVVRQPLLATSTPMVSQVCSFKVKGRVRRRCKYCYVVVRDQRSYVICPKFPRHKQMAMKPKPHNTWILTDATQSPVRAW